MARRRQTLQIPEAPDASRNTEIITYRDQIEEIAVDGYSGPLAMAISDTPGGEPLVEIPGVGLITIFPSYVDSLSEGNLYFADIWDRRLPREQGILVQRRFRTRDTIAPFGVDLPTQFLGGRRRVTLTARQYHDLEFRDHATTDYLIIGFGPVDPDNPPPEPKDYPDGALVYEERPYSYEGRIYVY